MQKQISGLLDKEMTRKEFMATLGFGVASIMGFSSILKLLTASHANSSYSKVSKGYGSSPYGGKQL